MGYVYYDAYWDRVHLELEKPSLFNGRSLETLPQIISLMRKYLFHIPYLACHGNFGPLKILVRDQFFH